MAVTAGNWTSALQNVPTSHKLKGPPRTTLVGVNLVARLSTAPL